MVRSIQTVADTCVNAIRAQCGDAEKIGHCVTEKSSSLSPSCQTFVATLQRTAQILTAAKGMAVMSADDKSLGQVVEVVKGPDGKILSVQVQARRFLGTGDRVVSIDANEMQQVGDRLKLRLRGDQISALAPAKQAVQ